MFLRRGSTANPYDELAEKIKRDLAETLKKKGIFISKVYIDLSTDKMNVSMCIREQ